jgi:hypothetical protein
MHSLDAPAPVRIALTREPDAGHATVWVNVQSAALVGRACRLEVTVALHRLDDGSAREKVLHAQPLLLCAGRQRIDLPAHLALYLYIGPGLSLRPALRLIDSKGVVLVRRTLSESRACLLGGRPRLQGCPQALMQPKDTWCAFASFSALAASTRRRLLGTAAAAILLAGGNLAVGVHDQWFAEHPVHGFAATMERLERERRGEPAPPPGRQPILYRPRSQGLPITDAGLLALVLGTLAWGRMRADLKRYASLEINLMLPPLRPGLRLPAAEVIRGRIDTRLRRATLRVVAANLECTQHLKDRVLVAVRTPVRAVLLYERELRHLPAGAAIPDQLDGEIDFTPMFQALYPAMMLDARHGLDIAWQVQLIHPDLIDLAVEGPVHSLRFVDFIAGSPTRPAQPEGVPA